MYYSVIIYTHQAFKPVASHPWGYFLIIINSESILNFNPKLCSLFYSSFSLCVFVQSPHCFHFFLIFCRRLSPLNKSRNSAWRRLPCFLEIAKQNYRANNKFGSTTTKAFPLWIGFNNFWCFTPYLKEDDSVYILVSI